MNTFIRPLLLFLLVILFIPNLQSQSISGKITDEETGEELIGANLVFFDTANNYATGASTDFNGNYKVTVDKSCQLASVEVSYAGHENKHIVFDGRKNLELNITLREGPITGCWVVVGFKSPLIDLENTSSGQTFTRDAIRNSTARGN